MATKRETLEQAARGEGCLGRSQDDEPIFVLCARDKTAPKLVDAWAQNVVDHFGRSDKTDSAFAVAREMEAWQAKHKFSKVPD